MNKFEQLLSDSTFSRVILANERTADFVLIEDAPWSDETHREFARRELRFAGVLGIIQGQPQSALAIPMDEATIDRLSHEFVRHAMASPNAAEFVAYYASLASNGVMH